MHSVTDALSLRRAGGGKRQLRGWLAMLLVLHRWMGVAVGAVMTLWCLTGFVMLYVDYPRLLPAEQLRGLSALHLPDRDAWAKIPLTPDAALTSARIEMVAGRPVLQVVPEHGDGPAIWQTRVSPLSFDIGAGTVLPALSTEALNRVASDFGRNFAIDGPPTKIMPISVDQWTVQAFRAISPLYRVDYADRLGSTAYIAGRTGEVVQQTTRFERFWGWLGAVPHWLYPTLLRQNPAAWSQVVIWTSLIGCFLTVTGMWVGIGRLRRGKGSGVRSPYRGLWRWHHIAGLVFGVLTLTWVGSGLLSMNPWGVFDSDAGQAERHRLAGDMTWSVLRTALAQLSDLPTGTVRVETAPLAGRMAFVAIAADGRRVRLGEGGRRKALTKTDVAEALRDGPPLVSLSLLEHGDDYFYAHKEPVRLPVWRAILADRQSTRLYIDADSGSLLRAVDGVGRSERWLWNAPHSFDIGSVRDRPLRDILILPLLAGVTLVCATGMWMGMRKLGRDLRRIRRRMQLAKAAASPGLSTRPQAD